MWLLYSHLHSSFINKIHGFRPRHHKPEGHSLSLVTRMDVWNPGEVLQDNESEVIKCESPIVLRDVLLCFYNCLRTDDIKTVLPKFFSVSEIPHGKSQSGPEKEHFIFVPGILQNQQHQIRDCFSAKVNCSPHGPWPHIKQSHAL